MAVRSPGLQEMARFISFQLTNKPKKTAEYKLNLTTYNYNLTRNIK
jgi:hypothetical protein